MDESSKLSRVIDLDIDIGADAVDYKFVCHSLFAFVPFLNEFFLVQLPTKSLYLV